MSSKTEDSGSVSSTKTKPEQSAIEFTPEYECYAGVEHEWTGTLFVPTKDEMAKQKQQIKPEIATVVISKPIIYVTEQPRGNRFARTKSDFSKVKMKNLDALKLRAKGQ